MVNDVQDVQQTQPMHDPNVLAVDYEPKSSLVLEEHIPEQPAFPVINAHTHTSLMIRKPEDVAQRMHERFRAVLGDDNQTSRDFLKVLSPAKAKTTIDEIVRIMDAVRVEQYVDLDGLLEVEEHFKLYGPHRHRFLLFHVHSLAGFDEPGYDKRLAEGLDRAVQAGARGFKVHKALGLTARDAGGKIIRIDDPRFDLAWAKAGELGVPVLMHCGDPDIYFWPIDRYNPGYRKLIGNSNRWYHAPDLYTKLQILEHRNNIIARHRKTNFLGAHHGNRAEDLKYVGDLLDKYPNFFIEFSYALVPLGLQPNTCRKHFIKYQDRILFGTDGTPGIDRYRMYYRFLETDDDDFFCGDGSYPARICGLNLPKNVLQKIYNGNAKRVLRPN